MGDIYERAYITIAATWASNCNDGLFSPEKDKYEARKMWTSNLYVRERPPRFPLTLQQRLSTDESSLTFWPLLRRAWVYQERLLSRRIVHFGKRQVHWECRSAFLQEDGTFYEEPNSYNNLGTAVMSFKTFPKATKNAWRKTVTEYTQLDLTYKSDRLPAIAAVAERNMRLRTGDIYVAGMWLNWENSLLDELAWYTDWWYTDQKHPNERNYARSTASIPTWSWASISTAIFWLNNNWSEDVETLPTPRLLDMGFTLNGPAHVGKVKDAYISISGPSLAATLLFTPIAQAVGYYETRVVVEDSPYSKDLRLAYIPDLPLKQEERTVMCTQEVIVVLLTRSRRPSPRRSGIVLREVSNGQYERVGYMSIRHESSRSEYATGDVSQTSEEYLDGFVASLPIREVTIT